MSITIKETPDSGRARQSLDGVVEYVLEYNCHNDTAAMTAADILATGGLPKQGTKYLGSTAVLQNRSIDPASVDRRKWLVTDVYRTKQEVTDSTVDPEDPTKQPAVVKFDSADRIEALRKAYTDGDAQGSPSVDILNPTKDPYDPPVTGIETDIVISIRKAYRSFDPKNILLYTNTMNAYKITIGGIPLEPYQGRITKLTVEPKYDLAGNTYDDVYCEIYGTPATHLADILEQGFNMHPGGVATEKRPVRLSDISASSNDETAVTEPVRLAADGTVLGADSASVYKQYKNLFPKDWQHLNLPTRKDGTA